LVGLDDLLQAGRPDTCDVYPLVLKLGPLDLDGVEHSVSVTAETLFEAVAKGIAIFRTENWVGDIGRGMTSLRITVKSPSVTHEVKMQEFENWLKRLNGSPAEMVLRNKLKTLLK
jgi:hypothetical protein